MDAPTPAQKRILLAAETLAWKLGRKPKQKEIAEEAGLKAASTLNVHLRNLERMGFVRRHYDTVECLKVRPTGLGY
ncbi:MAG: hypothetical protein IT546_05200 [Caulobacteraceae bacterium]|nr:hypothetical protein [Caulobacteraceae bacterium]